MSRLVPLWLAALTVTAATTAHAQAPSGQLPQRWILAGDSIQAQVFGNAEFNLPGGDARDLTAAIIMQDTGVAIQNVSSPGATINPAPAGIAPDPTDPARRRLFASSLGPGGQLQLDNIHLSSAGHRLFADRLIDFMVGRGFWRRR